MTRTCLGCPAEISARNISGRCRPCLARRNNACPVFAARRAQAIRASAQDPARRAKMAETARRNGAKWRASPEGRAKMVELGHNMRRHAYTPEAQSRWKAGRAEAGARRTATVLAWCPEERRGRYLYLVRTKRMKAADAKALVLSEINKDNLNRISRRHFPEIRHFLTKFAPVIRKGEDWLYGTATLSAEAMAERAMAKGWRPDPMLAGLL